MLSDKRWMDNALKQPDLPNLLCLSVMLAIIAQYSSRSDLLSLLISNIFSQVFYSFISLTVNIKVEELVIYTTLTFCLETEFESLNAT